MKFVFVFVEAIGERQLLLTTEVIQFGINFSKGQMTVSKPWLKLFLGFRDTAYRDQQLRGGFWAGPQQDADRKDTRYAWMFFYILTILFCRIGCVISCTKMDQYCFLQKNFGILALQQNYCCSGTPCFLTWKCLSK